MVHNTINWIYYVLGVCVCGIEIAENFSPNHFTMMHDGKVTKMETTIYIAICSCIEFCTFFSIRKMAIIMIFMPFARIEIIAF